MLSFFYGNCENADFLVTMILIVKSIQSSTGAAPGQLCPANPPPAGETRITGVKMTKVSNI